MDIERFGGEICRKGTTRKTRNGWEFNIKVFLEKNGRELDSFDLGTGPVKGCCETG